LEEWLVFIRLGPEIERIAEHRQIAAAVIAPSAELLNQRRRVGKLQALLSEFDSPGIRSDLQQAQERLAALEPQPSTRRQLTAMERLRVGSSSWWEESSPTERNAELLAVIAEARVDLCAWKALPPQPIDPPAVDGWGRLEDALTRGRWQQACAAALIPELRLRS
jgi:hypothetical protein